MNTKISSSDGICGIVKDRVQYRKESFEVHERATGLYNDLRGLADVSRRIGSSDRANTPEPFTDCATLAPSRHVLFKRYSRVHIFENLRS
ncbi:hypothetical protein RB195_003002 [Necator americanus]|uniref:Uncharacterized protein n=1 Tax=Necator americanus TaxID=51031 RepID=A0ABR1DLL7_NECAM